MPSTRPTFFEDPKDDAQLVKNMVQLFKDSKKGSSRGILLNPFGKLVVDKVIRFGDKGKADRGNQGEGYPGAELEIDRTKTDEVRSIGDGTFYTWVLPQRWCTVVQPHAGQAAAQPPRPASPPPRHDPMPLVIRPASPPPVIRPASPPQVIRPASPAPVIRPEIPLQAARPASPIRPQTPPRPASPPPQRIVRPQPRYPEQQQAMPNNGPVNYFYITQPPVHHQIFIINADQQPRTTAEKRPRSPSPPARVVRQRPASPPARAVHQRPAFSLLRMIAGALRDLIIYTSPAERQRRAQQQARR